MNIQLNPITLPVVTGSQSENDKTWIFSPPANSFNCNSNSAADSERLDLHETNEEFRSFISSKILQVLLQPRASLLLNPISSSTPTRSRGKNLASFACLNETDVVY